MTLRRYSMNSVGLRRLVAVPLLRESEWTFGYCHCGWSAGLGCVKALRVIALPQLAITLALVKGRLSCPLRIAIYNFFEPG